MNVVENNSKLPKGWKMQKFADVIEFLTDFQANGSFAGLKENVHYYQERNYAVLVRLKDLRNDLKEEKSFVYTDEKGYNFLKKSRVAEGDILVANVGAGVGTTLKMPKFNLKATLGPNMFRVDLKSTVARKYFLAFSNSLGYWQQLKNVSAGSGQPKINKSQYKCIEIPVPPFETQLAIVSKVEELFSELDKGIENLRLAQKQLKTYRQAVLKWAFEGRLTNENVKDGALPGGWKLEKLGGYIEDISSGKSYRCDERPPEANEVGIVKVSAVTWGFFDEMESKTCFSKNLLNDKYLIKKGDFLFSRANTIEFIGACVLVHSVDRTLMLSDKILRFTFSNKISKKYALYYLRSRKGRKQIEILSTGNQDSMRNIGQEKIRQIEFPYCSVDEQDYIVQAIESRLSVVDKLEESIIENLKNSNALKQSVLRDAFDGALI